MKIDVNELFDQLKNSNLAALSRAITIVESKAKKHQIIASQLVNLAKKENKQSIRIGISGMPGAGKSTFIDSFGTMLIEQNHKVAVIAVDPSSTVSKGSILGDKTRMEELSQSPNSFIRPSPSGGYLGGTAGKTRDLISLFEAANYDIIIIETVGIGQSETEVKTMVDFFLLLILPAGGDELQGIKKGAVELADMIIINKADGDKLKLAKRTKLDYHQAVRILGQSTKFENKVVLCSALEKTGLDTIWNEIINITQRENYVSSLEENRKKQEEYWVDKTFRNTIIDYISSNPKIKAKIVDLKSKILNNEISTELALSDLLDSINIE